MAEARAPGRPRSERARRAVLDATRQLVGDVGYDALTIDAIAQRAGVGRQTIYRWWKSKSSIIAEAVLEGLIAFPEPAVGTGEQDLRSWLRDIVGLLDNADNAALVRALAAAAASDPGESQALYEFGTRQAHSYVVELLRRGVAAGLIRSDIDPDAAADSLIGAVLYRILARVPFDEDYADKLLTPLLAG